MSNTPNKHRNTRLTVHFLLKSFEANVSTLRLIEASLKYLF